MSQDKKINRCLNFMKAICCISVVLMHSPFPSKIINIILYPLKFAVPVFFLISGFYCYNVNRKIVQKKLPKKIIHILKILLVSEALYGIYYIIHNNDIIALNDLKEIIVKIFTGTFFNGTLWFLYALFWGYVSMYIINKYNLYKKAYIIAPIILIFHMIIRIWAKTQDWYNVNYFRSFLLYGLPFLLMGSFIKSREKEITSNITNRMCIIGVIIGEVLVCIEYIITRTALDFYIGTIIVALCLFIFAIKNPNKYFFTGMEAIGEKLSMYVYVVHIFAIDISSGICEKISNIMDINVISYFVPVISVLLSLIISYIAYITIMKIKNRKEI